MEKWLIDRRMEQMRLEGVEFKTGVNVGVDVSADEIMNEYDATVLACGSEQPRDLPVPGRELKGVHFAMDFLVPSNKTVARRRYSRSPHRDRQTRNRHRRRRYRLRLRGHVESSGSGFDHPD